jgi:lysophospholipid acyltransferase (LPLAT)-like uncharacterized protein
MLPIWYTYRSAQASALVSASEDGALLAQFLTDLEFRVVRGSSSRGGREALDDLVALARSSTVLITPDGPRGPRHEAKPGAVITAHRAGVPLVLCRAAIHSKRVLGSWDRFEVPLPFAVIDVVFSEPVSIPRSASREQLDSVIAAVTRHLNEMVEES